MNEETKVQDDKEEEIQEIKVEMIEKKSMMSKLAEKKILMSIIKVLLGLYVIGTVVGLNEYIMMHANPVLDVINNSAFMTGTFTAWADIVFGPVRFMIRLMSWFTVAILINSVLFFVLSKIKWISKKELKIFFYMMIISLLLIF